MPVQPTPSGENLLVGKGQVLFDRFDTNGLPTGFRHLGNVSSMELTTADDVIEKFSSMSAGAPLYKRVNRRRNVTLKLTMDEFDPENVALALMGSTSVLVQPATAVVGEAVFPSTVPGSFFKLAKLGPYTGVTITFGATPGVLGVDYRVVDAKAGIYQILLGTAMTGAVTAGYTPTAYTGTTGPKVVGGGTSGVIEGKLMFIGDPSTGPKTIVEVWRLNISPDSAVGLISDEFAEMGLTAGVLDDSALHPSNPLYQVTYVP
jgi:hypothetical protein